MEQKFLEFIADVMEIDSSKISMETQYKNFERWDSLMMLTLVMEIEAEYSVTVPMEKLGEVKTLSDLYDFVKG